MVQFMGYLCNFEQDFEQFLKTCMSENCVPFKIRKENWKFFGHLPLLYISFLISDHFIHPLKNETINVTDSMLMNRTSRLSVGQGSVL